MIYFATENEITIIMQSGDSKTILKSDDPEFFVKIVALCIAQKEDEVNELLNDEKVEEFANVVCNVDGHEVKGRLAQVILDHYKQGIPAEYLRNFVNNLYKNPSYRVVHQLFDFIEASKETSGGFTITEDGCILGYKRVANDFTDLHSHTFDNSPGKVVEVPRNFVDEDPEKTCSYGLHFCSFNYLQYYGSDNHDRVVLVKVNPADVVAIPKDYNNTKARCCKYEVLEEYVETTKETTEKKVASVYTNVEELRKDKDKNTSFSDLLAKVLGNASNALKDASACIQVPANSLPVVILPSGNVTVDGKDLSDFTNADLVRIYEGIINARKADLIQRFPNYMLTVPSKFRDKITAMERIHRFTDIFKINTYPVTFNIKF